MVYSLEKWDFLVLHNRTEQNKKKYIYSRVVHKWVIARVQRKKYNKPTLHTTPPFHIALEKFLILFIGKVYKYYKGFDC